MNEPAAKTHGPVAPYMAVGLSTVVYGIAERSTSGSTWRPSRTRSTRPCRWSTSTCRSSSSRWPRARSPASPTRSSTCPTRWPRRAVHRHPRRGDRVPGPPGEAVRHLHHRAVQGPLAGGDGRPLLQHAVRHRPGGRGRAQGGQEPPLVPGALVHAARRLRPLGRAVRRRHRRLLPGAAHRRHRQHRHDLLQRRRVSRRRCAHWPSTAPRSSTGRARPCR